LLGSLNGPEVAVARPGTEGRWKREEKKREERREKKSEINKYLTK
jgi:hypothetical protein